MGKLDGQTLRQIGRQSAPSVGQTAQNGVDETDRRGHALVAHQPGVFADKGVRRRLQNQLFVGRQAQSRAHGRVYFGERLGQKRRHTPVQARALPLRPRIKLAREGTHIGAKIAEIGRDQIVAFAADERAQSLLARGGFGVHWGKGWRVSS